MDAETRAYLDQAIGAMRQDFAGLRVEFTDLRGEFTDLRGEVTGLRGEVTGLRGEVTELRDGLTGQRVELNGLRQEVNGVRGGLAELRTEVRETALETRRHFEVTAEALRHDVQTVAEGVAMTNERVDRLGSELRAEMNERFMAQEAMLRIAFRDVRRDIEDLRARL